MGNIESPKSIYQIIEQLKEDMVTAFPKKREQIIGYADSAQMAMDQGLGEGREINEICALLDEIDKTHAEKILPEIRDKIRGLRFLLRDQIEKGNILVPNLKKGKSALPEETDEGSGV